MVRSRQAAGSAGGFSNIDGNAPRLVRRIDYTSWMFWKVAYLRIILRGWRLPPNSTGK